MSEILALLVCLSYTAGKHRLAEEQIHLLKCKETVVFCLINSPSSKQMLILSNFVQFMQVSLTDFMYLHGFLYMLPYV